MFKFEVEGLESIDKEFQDQLQDINKGINSGLNVVGADMKNVLRQYIRAEVYDKYTPKNYIRRLDDGGMLSLDNMSCSISDNTLSFVYEFPTSPSSWQRTPRNGYYQFQDGDDAIKAIQSGKNYPTYGVIPNLKARPFWNLFILDYFGTGMADQSFTEGLNSYKSNYQATVTKSVQLEAQDYEQIIALAVAPVGAATEHISTSSTSYDFGDDDLPF